MNDILAIIGLIAVCALAAYGLGLGYVRFEKYYNRRQLVKNALNKAIREAKIIQGRERKKDK